MCTCLCIPLFGAEGECPHVFMCMCDCVGVCGCVCAGGCMCVLCVQKRRELTNWADLGSQPLGLLCTSLLGQSSHPSDTIFLWTPNPRPSQDAGWVTTVLLAPKGPSPTVHACSPLPGTFSSPLPVLQWIPWAISSHQPPASGGLQP